MSSLADLSSLFQLVDGGFGVEQGGSAGRYGGRPGELQGRGSRTVETEGNPAAARLRL